MFANIINTVAGLLSVGYCTYIIAVMIVVFFKKYTLATRMFFGSDEYGGMVFTALPALLCALDWIFVFREPNPFNSGGWILSLFLGIALVVLFFWTTFKVFAKIRSFIPPEL